MLRVNYSLFGAYLIFTISAQVFLPAYSAPLPDTFTLKNGIDAQVVNGEQYYIAGKVRFYEGNSVIKKNIDLDFHEEADKESIQYYKGIIIDGDLRVEGNIFNHEDDYGKFLEVKGDLYVDNLVVGGAQVIVRGDIFVKYFTVQTYNHGTIMAQALHTPVLIAEERSPELKNEDKIKLLLHDDYPDEPNKFNYSTLNKVFKDNKDIVMKQSWTDSNLPEFSLGDFIKKILDGADKKLLAQITTYQEDKFTATSDTLVKEEEVKKADHIKDNPEKPLAYIKEYANKILVSDVEIDTDELTESQIKDITLIDFSGAELPLIPNFIGKLEHLKHLDFSGNAIQKVPDFLSKLGKLKYLDLSDNNISTFSDSIANLEKITYLSLESNQIRVIPKLINNLKNIENLNLSTNAIVLISKEIGDLTKLTQLSLAGNNIESLPAAFFNLKNLEVLNLENCYIKINNDVAKLTKLTDLNISSNLLKPFPESIVTLKILKKLNLNNTYLTELPDSFSRLESLEWLHLGSTQFKTIPKVLTKIKSLKYLNMFNCRLTELPDYMSEFENLEYLGVESNKLTSVANIRFPALKTLDLDGNEITVFSPSITNITSLEKVVFDSEHISEIPKEIGKLINLKTLEMGSYKGKLSTLPKSFTNLKKLEKLDLSSNQFSKVPQEVFTLDKLRDLDFGSNKITEIPKEIIQLNALEELSFSSNQISSIPYEIAELASLETFFIYENPIENVPESILDEGIEELQAFLTHEDNKKEDSLLFKFFKNIFD